MVLRNSLNQIHWLFVPLKNQVNTLLLDAVNSMLKFVLMILKKILLTVKLLNQTPSSHSRKLLLLHQVLFAWPSHPINITESMLKLLHFTLILLIILKKVESLLRMILNQEPSFSVKNSNGTKMMLLRFGVLVLIMLVVTSLLKKHQVYNILVNLENQWKVLGNGQPKKLLCAKKTWEVFVLIFLIVSSMLMPSTEEVVKSYQQLENSTMHVN